VNTFFEIKKIKKKLKRFQKKLKKKSKKPGADMWNVLLKNVNYLNTVSENDKIDHNLTKIRT